MNPEVIQPFIDAAVQTLLGLLFTILVTLLVSLRKKVLTWLEARTTANQREILHRLAGEGMAFAEATFKQYGGDKKLDEALMYVISRASEYGIHVGIDTIRAAIEKAVLDYNAKVKAGGGTKQNAHS